MKANKSYSLKEKEERVMIPWKETIFVYVARNI
jgi:hypothetical protein